MTEENSDNSDKLQVSMATEAERAQNLIASEEEIYEEIGEFLEENVPEDSASIEDINDALNDVKDLRRIFKRAHRQMKWVDNYNIQ